MWDPLDDAIHKTVHEYTDGNQSGAVALAPAINMNAGTLTNKANPGMELHQLSLRESVPLQNHAKDYRILHSYSYSLGHASYPLGDFKTTSDVELLDLTLKFVKEVGDVSEELRKSLADGDITQSEFNRIDKQMCEAVQAMAELRCRVKGLVI